MKLCRNRKRFRVQMIILSFLLFFSIPEIAYAGNINGNESRVLGAMGATYEYGGKKYKLSSGYISEARAFLSQDGVDLTSEEAQEVLNMAYSNIAQGVSDGYLVEIEESSGQKKEEDTDPSQSVSSDKKTEENSSNNPKEKDNLKDKVQEKTDTRKKEPVYSMKTKEETSEIAVVNAKGEAVLNLPIVIKNTGFSLQRTRIFVFVSSILILMLLLVTASKYLFIQRKEE